jgi:hypothetical protein
MSDGLVPYCSGFTSSAHFPLILVYIAWFLLLSDSAIISIRQNTKRAIDHFGENDCPRDPSKASFRQSKRPVKRQQTLQLGVPTLSRAKKLKLDEAAALAVYMGARPFCLWDDFYIKAFLDLLGDGLYATPTCQRIGGDLLDEAYLRVQGRVLNILREQDDLQFVLDESPDLNHWRMVNLSTVIPGLGSYTWRMSMLVINL